MSKKSIILTATIVVLFIAAAMWYLNRNFVRVDGDPWEMIPGNAALIIEIDKPGDVLAKLRDDNSIWNSLLRVAEVEDLDSKLSFLDTLLNKKDEYAYLLWNSPLKIAFYEDSTSTIETLILSKIERSLDIESVKSMLRTKLSGEFDFFDIANIPNSFKVVNRDNEVGISYFAIINGVFIYSSSVDLLNELIKTFSGKQARLTEDPEFAELRKTGGENVIARVFIQYSEFSKLIEPLVIPEKKYALQWISNFAGWTEVDMLLKNSEIIFSGFSISGDDNSYLSTLKGQQAVRLKALNIIPFNAVAVIWLGIPDFKEYFYKNTTESKAKKISSKLNFDINKFIDVVGDEIVLASNAESPTSTSQNSWVIVKTDDKKNASVILKRIALNTGNKKVVKHKNYEINRINNTNFIPGIFGSAFSVIQNNYYTFIGEYAVFANSANAVINLINYFETGKTLDLNDNFKAFSDNISSQSNLLLYIRPGELAGRLSEYLNSDVVNQFEINEKVVNSFQGIALQVSLMDKLSFTNFYAKYSETYHEENLALWKVMLDDEIVWGPYLVYDHQTKKQNVIVFDKQGSMYLIDYDGVMLWKKKLDNIPMSDVYQVDYYKNRKIQYLFNTADYIYLIDKKGRNVTGYPKKLHSKATNGIAVFDYLNNKDYRLLIAQADKRVYNYTVKGKEVKGWSQPRTQNIVVEPVTRLLANKKDYIIISDIENEIKIVNRKGKRRIKLSGNINKAKNSDYYVNNTNSKGIIITTDEKGQLVYISSSGKLKHTDFGGFSPGHFFLYEDFNGDKSKDFIFVDGENLIVFDRFKNKLFTYQFGSDITIKPAFFNLGSKQHVLGVVADKERTIYLFDKKGNIIISKGLVGETPFTVGSLENDSKINLVSAAGNMLYNYRLQ